MPFKDRTNIKYGKLTAIEYLGKSMWKCQCDCGNEKIVYGGHLENGHTKSCGCFRPPRRNLIGQRFGRLTPIEWLGDSKWNCQCDCGNIVTVKTSNLTSGNTQSCGCLQKDRSREACLKDLVGKRFGKLQVIERAPNNRFGHTCWKCECDCGGIIVVDVNNLRNGNTSSCGCIKSKGEMTINNWLKNHNINYQSQYSFENFKLDTGRTPYFDFAIFDNDNNLLYLIEYDGKQHFEYSGYGWDNKENFEKTIHRDNQKNEWCKKMNYKLYRISYKDNIEKYLENIFEVAE